MIYIIQVDDSKYDSVIPFGPLYVGSALKRAGHEVKIFHCTEKETDSVVKEVAEAAPLFVGLSVMTGTQTKHSTVLSRRIREASDVPIVWGGIHPSILPEECLREDYIDIVVIGEGEETAVELAERLSRKGSLEGISGVGHRDGINSSRPLIADLGSCRIDFDLLPLEDYIETSEKGEFSRRLAYKSSRGCPFSCGFCYNLVFNRRRWRPYPTEVVLEDIDILKQRYQIDSITFYDDNFYVQKKRALEILKSINVRASTEMRIDIFDGQLARDVEETNPLSLFFGIESGSERLLRLMNKELSIDCIKKRVKTVSECSFPVHYGAITGLPTEMERETQQTLDLLLWIDDLHQGSATVTAGIYLPYPGTPLYPLACENGFVPPEDTEGWGNLDRSRMEFSLPWARTKVHYYIRRNFEFLGYYHSIKPLKAWFKFRLGHRFFSLPFDIILIEWLQRLVRERTLLGRLFKRVYDLLRATSKPGVAGTTQG